MKALRKFALNAIALSFIFPVSIFANIQPFDVLILAYLIGNAATGRFSINSFAGKVVLIGVGGILISSPFLLFANNIEESFYFWIQLVFITVIIPLFIQSLISSNLLIYFLKAVFACLMLLIGLIAASFILLTLNDARVFLHIGYGWATLRLKVGDLLPNDLNHYLVFGLFLTWKFGTNYAPKQILNIINIIAYLLTQSKTVVLTLAIYLMRFNPFVLVLVVVMATTTLVSFKEEYPIFERVYSFVENDYETDDNTTTHRIAMFNTTIDNFEKFVLTPLFGVDENLSLVSESRIASAHNIALSIIVNLGLISFIYYFMAAIIVARYVDFKNTIIFFLFLDVITIFFNPLMTARVTWLPFYVFIFYYHLTSPRLNKISRI